IDQKVTEVLVLDLSSQKENKSWEASLTLTPQNSVFQAEILAIKEALSWIKTIGKSGATVDFEFGRTPKQLSEPYDR
ncbi:Hypothetical protein FKW44_019042, partial [Caligus rogercresseyi]